MFIDKFKILCERDGTKIRAVAKELGIGNSTVTKWINGSTPQLEHAKMVAQYFDVTLDYLIGDEPISIKPSKKGFSTDVKLVFKTLKSLPQRWTSLRRGDTVPNERLLKIAQYTNCDILYLFAEDTQYAPPAEYDLVQLFETETLHQILDIMDKCADSDPFRILQVQLSRIVVYHLGQAGITGDMLLDLKPLDSRKVRYIIIGEQSKEATINYGFNYSDLSAILETYDEIPSYQYMFTGVRESLVDLLRENTNLKKKILDK